MSETTSARQHHRWPRALARGAWILVWTSASAVATLSAAAPPKQLAPKPACKPPAPDAKPLEVKLVSTESAIFSAAGTTASAVLPVQLPPGVVSGELTVELLQVRRDKLLDPIQGKQFVVQPKLVKDDRGLAAVDVAINKVDELIPGAYQLVLQFKHACQLLAPLTATLERPAATFQTPSKVLLDLTLPVGFGAKASAAPASVVLSTADATALSSVRSARLRDADWRTSTGKNINASLGASAAPASAGQPLSIVLAPIDFPLGVSNGKLELSSPDLRAPIKLEVEVHARLWSFWIPILVLLGIGTGYLVRTYLPHFVALRQARVNGAGVIEALTAKTRDIKDATFHKAIDLPLETLATVWRGGTAERITAEQVSASKVVEDALASLNSRVEVAQGLLRALRRLSADTTVLPRPLELIVAELPAACDAAAEHLTEQDAASAWPLLDEARTKLLKALRLAWPQWLQKFAALDTDLNLVHRLMDPGLAAARGTGAHFAQGAHDRAGQGLGVPEFEDLVAVAKALDAWRTYGLARRTALGQWAEFLQQDGDTFLGLIGARLPANVSFDAERASLVTLFSGLHEALAGAAQNSYAFAEVQLDARQGLTTVAEVVRTLLAKRADVDSATRTSVNAALDEYRCFDAVLAVPYLGAQQSPVPVARASKLVTGKPTAKVEAHDAEVKGDTFAPLPVVDPAVLELVRSRASRELLVAQRWQTGLVAFVTLGASYAFFEERFVGTPGDVMGLLFWGLSVDLSAAGLLALGAGLATAPKR